MAALTLNRNGWQVSAPELYYDFNWPKGHMPASFAHGGGVVPLPGEVVPVRDWEGNRCIATVTRVDRTSGGRAQFWIELDMSTWEPA